VDLGRSGHFGEGRAYAITILIGNLGENSEKYDTWSQ
jgi:hypothetical protein